MGRRTASLCLAASLSAFVPAARADVLGPDAERSGQASDWLQAGRRLEQRSGEAAPVVLCRADVPAGEPAPYVAWRRRRGPAYPERFWHSVGRDAKEFVPMMLDDARATVTDPVSLALLAVAGAAGIALSGGCADDRVEEHFNRHGGCLSDAWDDVGDVGGNPGTHFAIAGAMYVASLARGDTRTYEVSKTLLSGLALNGITTMALKGLAHTESPNGDELGWPSGHTSSTFTLATVLNAYYGPWVGVPLFAFAGFVGYERIDARNHDFSDVVSGAFLGIAIGYAVSRNHRPKVFGMDVVPFSDPARSAVGVALVKRF